jgi:hypothetical protein
LALHRASQRSDCWSDGTAVAPSLARRFGLARRFAVAGLCGCIPHAADRTTQKLGLLVRLLEPVTAAAARLASFATRALDHLLGRALRRRFASWLGPRLWSRLWSRLDPRLGLPVAVDEALPLATITPIAIAKAGRTLLAVATERTVGAVVPLRPVAPIGPLGALRTPRLAALVVARLMRARLRRVTLGLGCRERLREAVVAGHVVVGVVEALTAHVTGAAHAAVATAVHPGFVRLIELVAVGHDDAVVMLGVLQIVLSQHRVSRRLGIARQRQVFLRNVSGGTADPLGRAVRLEAARQRIVVALPAIIVVAATSAAVLLSLPH